MSTEPAVPANPVTEAIKQVAPSNDVSPEGVNALLGIMQGFANPTPEPVTPAPAPTPDPEPTPVVPQGEAEVDPDLSDLPPDATTPEAKETWKTLKQTKKQLAEQLENEKKLRLEYEEKVKKASEPPPVDPEQEARLKRLEELERRVAMVDIEATSDYRTLVLEPAAKIEQTVEMIVKSYDGTDDQVTAILNALAETNLKARREKLNELTSEFDTAEAAQIKLLANDFQGLIQKRDQLKADAANALKEAKASEVRKAEQMTQMERAAYKAAVKEAQARLAEGLKPKFGESVVAALETAAESVSGDKFEFTDPNVKAFAALSAAALPTLVSAHTKLQAEVAELKATLAAYEKASPKPGGVSTPAPATPEPMKTHQGAGDILSRMRG